MILLSWRRRYSPEAFEAIQREQKAEREQRVVEPMPDRRANRTALHDRKGRHFGKPR